MKHVMKKISWIVALAVMVLTPATFAQDDRDDDRDHDRSYDSESFQRRDDDNDRYGEPMRIDRYLDVQVWTNRDDAEYYAGDNIVINFRANRDCFAAIYSIDSRGRVDLLFPADPSDDNYITGGVTYHLPAGHDKYDLVVSGPSGREHIQMIASREKFPIPNWYRNSGLVFDGDDRDEYMDNLNERYFARYPGQRFGLDRALVFVNEWEPDYYRPIYSPYYPNWAMTGNVYFDYPWGGSVYVNGIYWGCAPLYIPRLVVGWHVVTIYDPWGYCWESDFHVNRYHTVVFDRTVVKTSRVVVSRYKEVNVTKWRDPVKSGYPDFKQVATNTKTPRGTVAGTTNQFDKSDKLGANTMDSFRPLTKKYARGETGLVKTGRGFETVGEAKGIRPAIGSSFEKSRRPADQSGGARSIDKTRVGDQGASGFKQRGGRDGNSGSNSGTVERRRDSEPSRVEPSSRTRTKSPSSEPAREQPKVEKKSEGESSNSAPKPSVKESPKSKPSSGKQAPSTKSKGDSDGKGKRPR